MTSDELYQLALDIMARAPYSFLITMTGTEAGVHARLMEHYGPDEDGAIWLGSLPGTRKINEVQDDPRVTLTFEITAERAFVVASGQAAVVDDAAARRRWWRAEWTEFFPGGPDHGYAVMRVEMTRIEVLSYAAGAAGDHAPVLVRSGDEWQMA